MAITYKVLGQVAPAITSETDLYAASSAAVASSIIVCNRGTSQSTFRVSISVNGAATTTKDYIYYDLIIAGNDTFIATIGVTLATGDVVRVYASSNRLSFSLYGSEVS